MISLLRGLFPLETHALSMVLVESEKSALLQWPRNLGKHARVTDLRMLILSPHTHTATIFVNGFCNRRARKARLHASRVRRAPQAKKGVFPAGASDSTVSSRFVGIDQSTCSSPPGLSNLPAVVPPKHWECGTYIPDQSASTTDPCYTWNGDPQDRLTIPVSCAGSDGHKPNRCLYQVELNKCCQS